MAAPQVGDKPDALRALYEQALRSKKAGDLDEAETICRPREHGIRFIKRFGGP